MLATAGLLRSLLLVTSACLTAQQQVLPVSDAPSALGAVFDGVGAITSNGETRLIYDYAPDARAAILDFLFTPGVGLALQILKIELGSDAQSTLGTEAAHIHNRGEAPACTRGIQWWFAQQARARNPDIVLIGLAWSAPGWVGNGTFFSPDNIAFTLSALECGRSAFALSLSYLGQWNEAPAAAIPASYLFGLRAALDAAGFASTRLLPGDTGVGAALTSALVADVAADAALRAIVPAIGFHHPCGTLPARWLSIPAAAGVRAFASEDYSLVGDAAGAACWGMTPARNWLVGNATATIAWGAAFAALPNTLCQGKGFLYAPQPWSGGAWSAQPAAWAMATWTWFTAPGWTLLARGAGSDFLPADANSTSIAVSLVSPPWSPAAAAAAAAPRDFTTILSTQACAVSCFHSANATAGVLRLTLAGGPLAGAVARGNVLRVWATNASAALLQLAPLAVPPAGPDGTASVDLAYEPGTLYAITSLPAPLGREEEGGAPASAAGSGGAAPPFPPVVNSGTVDAFPLPYADDFEGVPDESYATFFSDWDGSFQVVADNASDGGEAWSGAAASGAANHVLRARALQPPIRWHCADVEPITMTAPGFANYDVAVAARVDADAADTPGAYAGLVVRINKPFAGWCPAQTGYVLAVCGNGTWVLRIWPANAGALAPRAAVLASGPLAPGRTAAGLWHTLRVTAFGARLTASVDGAVVADLVDASFAHGTIGLASGWHHASFDAFQLAQVGPAAPSNGALWARYLDGGVTTDFAGWAGAVIAPLQPTTLTALGRFVGHNASGAHRLAVLRASDNATLALVTLNLTQTALQVDPFGFAWASIAPGAWVPLVPGESYYVVSEEAAGGDPVYMLGPATVCAGDNAVRSPVMGVRPAVAALVAVTGSVSMAASGAAAGRWLENAEGEPRALGPVNFALQV